MLLKMRSRGEILSNRPKGVHLLVLGNENPPLRLANQDFAPAPGLGGCAATSFIMEVFEEKKDNDGLVEESEVNGEDREEERDDVGGALDEPLVRVERMRWYTLATTPSPPLYEGVRVRACRRRCAGVSALVVVEGVVCISFHAWTIVRLLGVLGVEEPPEEVAEPVTQTMWSHNKKVGKKKQGKQRKNRLHVIVASSYVHRRG